MNKYIWAVWIITIGMGILSFTYGCCEMPDREMNEHESITLDCILLSDGKAICV